MNDKQYKDVPCKDCLTLAICRQKTPGILIQQCDKFAAIVYTKKRISALVLDYLYTYRKE